MDRIVYIDCFSGISGDMLLGALVDAGVPLERLQEELGKLGLGTEITLRAEKVMRGGMSALKVHVDTADDSISRNWKQIKDLLEKSGLDDDVKAGALRAFERLARCEAEIHNIPVEKVHFHELSGADAIADIAGAFIGMKILGAARVVASAVNVGSGTVMCRHGVLPVPAPATAALLRGAPVFSQFDGELTTPTGALLLTEFASEFGAMPEMVVETIGCGAGGRETAHPNVLRVFTGRAAASGLVAKSQPLAELHADLDDMNPEIVPFFMERALERGALDVFAQPGVMKKGRPGIALRVLCAPERVDDMLKLFFEETTTLGVRIVRAERVCLERFYKTVDTEYGAVRVKIGALGDKIMNVKPEYEECAHAARAAGVSVARVMDDAAHAAARDGFKPGAQWNSGDMTEI